MTYMRGITEKGIEYDGEFFTVKNPQNTEASAFLNNNFERVDESRWQIRKPKITEQVMSFGRSVFSGPAAPEVVERRKLSCFGDAENPSCVKLEKTPLGAFCTECACGKWLLSDLQGRFAPKLGWAYLECPLKRPGFSNEVKS